jgi:hypothetical protein
MNIGLLNLEPKYKNLALEKIRIYHQQKGDFVEDYFAIRPYDKVYCSSIFTFTKKTIVPQGAIYGGSGFDLTTTLPSEIDDIKPHLNFGFTTRGCSNKCPFCIVHIKEGDFKITGTLKDLWNGIKRVLIILMDNNILCSLDHFFSVCRESIEYQVKLDINQGLDHRKLTPEVCDLMKKVSHTEYRFAFDSPAYYSTVDKAITMLQNAGINRSLWYVLVGYNTSFQEDLDRLNFLRDRGQQGYIQRYHYKSGDFKYIALAQWVNQHHIFYGMTWEQFLESRHSKQRKYDKLVNIAGNTLKGNKDKE